MLCRKSKEWCGNDRFTNRWSKLLGPPPRQQHCCFPFLYAYHQHLITYLRHPDPLERNIIGIRVISVTSVATYGEEKRVTCSFQHVEVGPGNNHCNPIPSPVESSFSQTTTVAHSSSLTVRVIYSYIYFSHPLYSLLNDLPTFPSKYLTQTPIAKKKQRLKRTSRIYHKNIYNHEQQHKRNQRLHARHRRLRHHNRQKPRNFPPPASKLAPHKQGRTPNPHQLRRRHKLPHSLCTTGSRLRQLSPPYELHVHTRR
jgi:hypothetical protein